MREQQCSETHQQVASLLQLSEEFDVPVAWPVGCYREGGGEAHMLNFLLAKVKLFVCRFFCPNETRGER